MARYRFRRGMAGRIALRLLTIALAFGGLVVGIYLFSQDTDVAFQKDVLPSPTYTGQPSPLPTMSSAGDNIATLSQSVIKQQGTLVLVNKWRLWPEGVEPTDLVTIKDYKTTTAYALKHIDMRADKTAVMALDEMLKAAGKDGMKNIVIMSSYRGYEKQRILFEERVEALLPQSKNREQAEEKANTTVAKPGESEHHTGLAFDLAVQDIAMEQFGDTTQGKWIRDHCTEYGFVLRYDPHKANLTGINSEPWHIRYVGISAAQKMKANNWCLEEYVAHNH